MAMHDRSQWLSEHDGARGFDGQALPFYPVLCGSAFIVSSSALTIADGSSLACIMRIRRRQTTSM